MCIHASGKAVLHVIHKSVCRHCNDRNTFSQLVPASTDALGGLLMRPAGRFNLKAFAGIGGAYSFGFPEDVPLPYPYE